MDNFLHSNVLIPTAAAVNWVLKDGFGYLSKIFLSKYGRHFDVHPKGWRLFADLLENAAYGMEMLTPAFPLHFVVIGAAAGAGRSAAALIQAATRSCFYAGFAAQRNFAEVIAKGEAQGMVSKSIGMMLGITLANRIRSSTSLALGCFSIVTLIHMFCNLKSYKSIQLRTLNPYRASLPKPSEEEMVNTYVKTLAAVVGSEEEAKKKIYSVSTTTYTGFGALISEELSYKVKELPGVLWVLPDSYLDVPNKDYGGDLFIDGKVIPRPQYRYHDRPQQPGRNRPRPRYDRRRETMQVDRRQPIQRQNWGQNQSDPMQPPPSMDGQNRVQSGIGDFSTNPGEFNRSNTD